jgi:hypothetical protein
MLASLVVSTTVALFTFAGVGLADPPDMLFDPVPKHRHFVPTASGELVPVGPQICDTRSCSRPSTSSITTCTTRSSRVSG